MVIVIPLRLHNYALSCIIMQPFLDTLHKGKIGELETRNPASSGLSGGNPGTPNPNPNLIKGSESIQSGSEVSCNSSRKRRGGNRQTTITTTDLILQLIMMPPSKSHQIRQDANQTTMNHACSRLGIRHELLEVGTSHSYHA